MNEVDETEVVTVDADAVISEMREAFGMSDETEEIAPQESNTAAIASPSDSDLEFSNEDLTGISVEEIQENGETILNAHEEIPVNSGSILVSEETSRFSSAIWYNKIQEKTITLAGVGGIGSYVGFLLARMKPCSLIIYDDDRVETVNMSGQFYGLNDVGSSKVTALSVAMRNYADFHRVLAYEDRFTETSTATDIMICGFDNMEARKTFFNKWLDHVRSSYTPENCLFIDGRLAAEEFQVLCIRGDDEYNIQRYQNDFLFSDSEADETICSYKQTTFCANMIGSIIVNLFVNFVANQCDPIIDRDLPFLTEYNAERMFFKTEA